MRVVLVGTYDLGRQPFGLALPAAWLRGAGHDVRAVDVSRTPLSAGVIAGADVVAFHLPMHTATRLALPLVARVRRLVPAARVVAYGLYAPLNEDALRAAGVSVVLGVESEAELCDVVGGTPAAARSGEVPRVPFVVPDRSDLPPLERYAALRLSGSRRVTGHTEASRGCRHWCRHCPVVPVYRGAFRIVPVEVVLADVAQQVAAGATHVTFGDPDFLNGPKHALAVVDAVTARFPGLSYDVTIKVEHLVAHAVLLPRLRATGCALVTSAFESFDDEVLRRLEKGHTRADALRAIDACRAAGLALAPTFVAFTPWTTRESYARLLEELARLDIVEDVAPIQLALRLLVTGRSRLLEVEDLAPRLGPFDPVRLVHPWAHPDPVVDAWQRDIEAIVSTAAARPRAEVFSAIVDRVRQDAPCEPTAPGVRQRVEVPYLDEPWYC